jgi:hypothetical protein
MLFHGIPHNLVDRVCKQGLDPRRGGTNVGKMFGVGTYLADLSSKSDIYTTPNDQGERCLLWVRACLGEAYQADKRNQDMTIPPERDDRKGPLNSVVALTKDEGGAVEHREFIVYKESQLLPQYAVWYKHRSACVCTHCYKKAFIECEDERDIVVTDCRTVGRILKAVRKKTDSGELPGFTSENVALMDCEGDILDDEDQELENFPITLKLVQMVEITVVPILPFCTVDRVSFRIATFPCETIAEIKLKIADLKGIPVDKQQLWLASEEPEGLEEVEDSSTLLDCGVNFSRSSSYPLFELHEMKDKEEEEEEEDQNDNDGAADDEEEEGQNDNDDAAEAAAAAEEDEDDEDDEDPDGFNVVHEEYGWPVHTFLQRR